MIIFYCGRRRQLIEVDVSVHHHYVKPFSFLFIQVYCIIFTKFAAAELGFYYCFFLEGMLFDIPDL